MKFLTQNLRYDSMTVLVPYYTKHVIRILLFPRITCNLRIVIKIRTLIHSYMKIIWPFATTVPTVSSSTQCRHPVYGP